MPASKDSPPDNVIALSRYRAQLGRGKRLRRSEALMNAPNPEAAIRALPGDELYYVVHETGTRDALDILVHATREPASGRDGLRAVGARRDPGVAPRRMARGAVRGAAREDRRMDRRARRRAGRPVAAQDLADLRPLRGRSARGVRRHLLSHARPSVRARRRRPARRRRAATADAAWRRRADARDERREPPESARAIIRIID